MNMENKQPKKNPRITPPPPIKITPPPQKKAEHKQTKNTQRRKNAKYFIYNQWKSVYNNRFIFFLPTEDPPDLDTPEEADHQVDRVQDSVQETRGAAGGYVLSKGQSLEVQLRHLR